MKCKNKAFYRTPHLIYSYLHIIIFLTLVRFTSYQTGNFIKNNLTTYLLRKSDQRFASYARTNIQIAQVARDHGSLSSLD